MVWFHRTGGVRRVNEPEIVPQAAFFNISADFAPNADESRAAKPVGRDSRWVLEQILR